MQYGVEVVKECNKIQTWWYTAHPVIDLSVRLHEHIEAETKWCHFADAIFKCIF